MSELIEEKKKAAEDLYMVGYEQSYIARVLSTQESTISRWKKDGDWKGARINARLLDKTMEEDGKEIVNYQQSIIKIFIKKNMELPEEERKLISAAATDGLTKLYTNIKKTEMKWADKVKTVRQLLVYVQEQDVDLAKQLTQYCDQYINDQRENI